MRTEYFYFNEVSNLPHDASGIEDPHSVMWYEQNGVMYPDTDHATPSLADRLIELISKINGSSTIINVNNSIATALRWAIGFERKYGLWHPDDDAADIMWSKQNPHAYALRNLQMKRFREVDWYTVYDLDPYSIVMIIESAIGDPNDPMGYIRNYNNSAQVQSFIAMLENEFNEPSTVNMSGNSCQILCYVEDGELTLAVRSDTYFEGAEFDGEIWVKYFERNDKLSMCEIINFKPNGKSKN